MKQIDRLRNMNAEKICKKFGACILNMTCEVCPADEFCSQSEIDECILSFKAWLESEVTDEQV